MHLRHLVALSYVRDHDACPQQELADALLHGRQQRRAAAQRARASSATSRGCATPTTAGATSSSSRARAARALARTERAQEEIEDEVLQALDPDERAHAAAAALTRALRSAEPVEDEAPYSATIASIST